jgi:peptide deformylase
MKYTIVRYGHPVLREKAKPIGVIDDSVRQLAADMLETMYAAEGVGLAAQQIALPLAICVVDVPPEMDVLEEGGERVNPDVAMPLVLVNPRVLSTAGLQTGREGCLSFPDFHFDVKRPMEATVEYADLDGVARTTVFRGFVARAVQHEIDHLNGVLFTDRISELKRLSMGGQLKRLRRATEEELAGAGAK